MPKNDKFKDEAMDSLLGWMENLEGTPSDELRAIRRELGHDVEGSERAFLNMLTEKSRAIGIELDSPAAAQASEPIEGLLIAAKEKGFSTQEFADATELSPVLVTMLDRGLIYFPSIPPKILDRVASVIKRSVEALSQYLQIGPRFASGANYKADEAPETEEPQDFFEAVIDDPAISEERRSRLLALRSE
jgi:transcriptional regulator with XRE-family HTH domain